jgi:hypothetical protein
MIWSGPGLLKAQPSSIKTFGLGSALPDSVLPIGVTSATNTAEREILLRIVEVISAIPGVFFVS